MCHQLLRVGGDAMLFSPGNRLLLGVDYIIPPAPFLGASAARNMLVSKPEVAYRCVLPQKSRAILRLDCVTSEVAYRCVRGGGRVAWWVGGAFRAPSWLPFLTTPPAGVFSFVPCPLQVRPSGVLRLLVLNCIMASRGRFVPVSHWNFTSFRMRANLGEDNHFHTKRGQTCETEMSSLAFSSFLFFIFLYTISAFSPLTFSKFPQVLISLYFRSIFPRAFCSRMISIIVIIENNFR